MVPPPIAIKAARWLAALAVVLVTVTGCGDLYCGVPKATRSTSGEAKTIGRTLSLSSQ